jgi:hypothetical protein
MRTLTAEDGRLATVRIGAPAFVAGQEWQCPIELEFDGVMNEKTSHGEDAIQALILAIELVRVEIKKTGILFTWIGEKGDAGFPRSVPSYFGLAFQNLIEEQIERELNEFIIRSQGLRK